MATPQAGRPDPRRLEPLWDRIDRNRRRLALYLVVFAATSGIAFGLLVASIPIALAVLGAFLRAPTLYGPLEWMMQQDVGPALLRWWLVGSLTAAVYEAWALTRSERWVIRWLGAALVPTGELIDTKMALKDMAIAGGMPVAPALYVIETDRVNAFVFGATRRRPILGITRGFVDRLSVPEQRAVFANLVARLVTGDSRVSSAVTAVMAPLQAWRESRLESLDAEDEMLREAAEQSRRFGYGTSADPSGGGSAALGLMLLLPWIFIGMIVLGEVVAAAHRRSQLSAAEKADGEGMLLLKDPRVMLSALEKCVRMNNRVVAAGDALGELFYCWPGEDSTDDEDDIEWTRMARLREVLGAEGHIPDDEPLYDDDSFAPVAPRIGG